jgi:hypothetical protein
MSKNTYWVTDAEGVYAQVEGADRRDEAVRVHGWAEAGEPAADAQVHVVHEDPAILPGRLPYGALEGGGWAVRGWKPGPPPQMAVSRDQAASDSEPVKPTKAAAPAAGEQKEK